MRAAWIALILAASAANSVAQQTGPGGVPGGPSSGTVTWPTSGSVVLSNGTNSPAGVTPVNGDCLLGSGGAWIAGSCGSAPVSSVANSDGTLTITPTTGLVVASLNLGNVNTWTGTQTFGTIIPTSIAMPSGGVISWNSDTGMSRAGANVVALGNGTAGNTGATLELNNLNVQGNGHVLSGSSSNRDISGEINFAGVTTGSYGFGQGWNSHPECVVTPQASTATSGAPWVTYTGTSSFTINFTSAFTGNVSYICIGRN